MIKTLEKSARTEDLAIAEALKELGMDRDDVSVEILTRAKSGFLGIGASPAVIRVTYEAPDEAVVPEALKASEKKPEPAKKAEPARKPEPAKKAEPARKPEPAKKAEPAKKPEPAKKAEPAKKPEPAKKAEPAAVSADDEYAEIRAFLTGLLSRMGTEADIEIIRRDSKGIVVNLSGANMGAIIGRRGETLDAIQHLTNYVINKGNDKHMHISVDAESYRAKREESLVHLAEKMAEKVIKYKRSMALEPMNSYERHIIHTALQNYEGVSTSSTGTEPNRRVVVSYDRPQSNNKPKSREWA